MNHGDEGLKSFLGLVSSLSECVVLEAQPWKCYRTAARRMRKLKQPSFHHLETMRCKSQEELDEFMDQVFKECGLEVIKQLGETEWNRKIVLLKRNR